MAEEEAAKSAGNFLTKKVGPLPLGVWMVAAIGIYYYLNKKNKAAASGTTLPLAYGSALTPSGQVATTGGIGSSDMSGGGGSTGNTGTSGGTTGGQYATNDAWGRAAVNYLVGIGVDPTVANSAITQFLASQTLTTDQQGQVNLAIQAIGAPPTLPQPGNAPPPVNNPPGGVVYATNPPTGLSITATDDHSATMVWNKSTNATGYTVSWTPASGGGSSVTVPGTDTHAYINGLSPNVTYTFKVQATPAKSTDGFASATATTASLPAPPPGGGGGGTQPPPNPHAGQHLQPPQVATLLSGQSLADYARSHYPQDTGAHLAILVQLNPSLNENNRNHPTMFIRTSNERWVNN